MNNSKSLGVTMNGNFIYIVMHRKAYDDI